MTKYTLTKIDDYQKRWVWARGHSTATPLVYVVGFFADMHGIVVINHKSRGGDRWLLCGVVEDDGEWFEAGSLHLSTRYIDEYIACLNATKEWVAKEDIAYLAAREQIDIQTSYIIESQGED